MLGCGTRKGVLKRLIFILFCIISSANAMTVSGDVVFTDDNPIRPNDIVTIDRSVDIENYTLIDTDIYVTCTNCDVRIKNYGEFKANLFMSGDANITQVVSAASDLKPIDVNVAYSILMDNVNSVDFADVLSLAARGAKQLIVKNSDIVITKDLPNVIVPLVLDGEVNIVVDDSGVFKDKVIFENVSGDGFVRVLVNNAGTMNVYETYIKGGSLYLDTERETDENKVFDDNNTGGFVNGLRDDKDAENLLESLDSASDMDEVHHVMSKSVRFNPDRLHDITRTIHAFDMVNVSDVSPGVLLKPWGIMTDDFWVYGLDAGIAINVNDDFTLSAVGRAGSVEYSNGIDIFDAALYGGNLYAKYSFGNNFVLNASVGMMKMDSDIGDVLYGKNVLHDPITVSGYGVINVGYDFLNDSGFKLSPFVGLNAEYYNTENSKDFDVGVRAGVGAGYVYSAFGIMYDYGLNLAVNTNADIAAMLRIAVWSEMDCLGGDITVGATRIMDAMAYKMSASMKIWF